MMNKSTRRKIKRVIGTQYTDEVLAILNQRGKKNKQGAPYNAAYIRTVFSGIRNNRDVQDAIYDLYEQKIKIQEERRTLLNNKKPEGATSGSL